MAGQRSSCHASAAIRANHAGTSRRPSNSTPLAAHRIVWANPLAGGEGYRPLVAGMRAALPYVDDFLPGHNLRALETLAEVLEEIDDGPRSTRADTLLVGA